MAIDTTTSTRVAGGTAQTTDAAPSVGSSGPDQDPSRRRLRYLIVLTVLAGLAFVALLGGALLSATLTRSPAGSPPAQPAAPTAPTQNSPSTGENPNQREGRVPIPPPATTGENPNQREGRVPIPPPATTGENPNQREGRVPIPPPATTGENPNQREGRVPIPPPATTGENPNQRESRVPGQD